MIYRCVHCNMEFKFWTGKRGAQTHANDTKHCRIQFIQHPELGRVQ